MNQKAINFFELLNYNENGTRIDKIIIPEIQRDYVQGRTSKSETEVRNSLIKDFLNTLQTGEEMELYFVYGKIEETENIFTFTPLDGQQRLTTLFLLYWYLSSDDSELDKIRIKNSEESYLSRFSYETREYSKSFIDCLVSNSYDTIVKDSNNWKLSDCIKDKNWFGFSWTADPTVQAILTMLDAFEEKIPRSELKKFISNFDKIKFFFLNLGDFGMTDKLYIKMNDRGKDLSDFDYTKSTFSGDVFSITQDVSKSNDLWDGKFDNQWMDCFWKYCFNTQNIFDIDSNSENILKDANTDKSIKDKLLEKIRKNTVSRVEIVYSRFINKIILLYLSEDNVKKLFNTQIEKNIYEKYYSSSADSLPNIYDLTDLIGSDKKFLHQSIRNNTFHNFYSFFNKIMERFFYCDADKNIFPVSSLLQNYVTFPENGDFNYILNKEKPEIDEYLLLSAAIDFILTDEYSAQEIYADTTKQKAFKEWILFCRNLVLRDNTFIDDQEKFLKMNNCILEWSEKLCKLKWNLKNNISMLSLGFNDSYLEKQLDEEKEKYDISTNDANLFDSIRIFENQRFYIGQIKGIIEMSKTNNVFDKNLFLLRISQLNSIFISDTNGYHICNKNLFRQALLCYGDWSLDFSPRKCFCLSTFGRDNSWRTFFRKEENYKYLRMMLDDWNKNYAQLAFEDYANEIVKATLKTNNINDWRKYFLENNELFDFMGNAIMYIKYNNNGKEYLLLRSSTYFTSNSNYGDLYTVSLFLRQYKIADIAKYTLSNNDISSFNQVKLLGKNKESIIVKSYNNNGILKYDVTNNSVLILQNVDQIDVEQYLSPLI